ncbi:hypothetical protein PHMEG_0003992 [Phytophthora megakarya]|uniref:Uncharacterized protein n=1 Tax=Phytophthora megakarya TaxID=4795 RepID=A0A225WV01_9STRA|nr:hypothetical protein PHMEG_0003992 [Phytophthora megakarya]
MQSLPSCVRVRNDPSRCRLDHLSRGEEDLFLDKGHCMRSIEMKYKILVCEQSDLAIIYMKYEHLILGVAASPKKPRLTTQMKTCLDEKLSENAALKPEDLFSLLASKVQRGQMEGPKPTKSQVQGYIKRWRSVNKQNFMQPVIDICSQSMYDTLENIDETGDNLIVFCDSKFCT